MAKKPTGLENIFTKTEPTNEPKLDTSDLGGTIKATGIGLSLGELAAVQAIADNLGLARNAVLRYAVRYFILQYRAGKVDLSQKIIEPPPQKKKLIMP